jgi:hypothetical protein
MAEALGVSVDDLLIGETGKAASMKAAKSNGRPAGKVRESSIAFQSSRAGSRNTSSTGSLPTSLSTSKPAKPTIHKVGR